MPEAIDNARHRAALNVHTWLREHLLGGKGAVTPRGCVFVVDDDPRWQLDNVLVPVHRLAPKGGQKVGDAFCQRVRLSKDADKMLCTAVFNEVGRVMAEELIRFGCHKDLVVPVWGESLGIRAETLTPVFFSIAYTDEELAATIEERVRWWKYSSSTGSAVTR